MFIDARRVESGRVFEADLCVVGAGAAGITLARVLAGASLEVCLVESGGFELDQATQLLYQGELAGHDYNLASMRLRFFGGSTNHWRGWCRPLEPLDFEVRPWVTDSGWPLRYEELLPYYARAQQALQLGPFDYDARRWAARRRPLLPFGSGDIRQFIWQFSPPTRFGVEYRGELERARNRHRAAPC